jgi:hypothetical protein
MTMKKSKDCRKLAWIGVATCFLACCGMAASTTNCSMYLAPSTIPGAGLGVFAGDHFYAKGERVGSGDILIPIVELRWHNSRNRKTSYKFLWDQYTWEVRTFPDMAKEADDPKLIKGASPGLGALPNCHLSLANVGDLIPNLSRGVRGDSPGVGATSPYPNREFKASRNIPPGTEIFAK